MFGHVQRENKQHYTRSTCIIPVAVTSPSHHRLLAQDVQEVHKHTRDPLNLESVMVLQMSEPEKSGVRKVARLLTHCSPKKYLNFKVKMFDTKDLDYVGGELGSAPRNQNHLSLLSTKLSSMVMQTDTEFQAKLGMQKTFDLKLNQLVLPDPTWNFPNCFKILRCFMVWENGFGVALMETSGNTSISKRPTGLYCQICLVA